MVFQWDESKNVSNQSKHGLRFEDAQHVFADPLSISRKDEYEGEERWQVIGHLYGVKVVLVVYTTRREDGEQWIRIISARKATAQERRQYEDGTWFS